MSRRIFAVVVAATYIVSLANGFAAPRLTMARGDQLIASRHISKLSLNNNNNNNDNNLDDDNKVTTQQKQDNNKNLTSIGTTEYYQGFLTRPPNEEPIERVTGDAILGPTLKFAGGISLGLVVLVLVFLGSNGLL